VEQAKFPSILTEPIGKLGDDWYTNVRVITLRKSMDFIELFNKVARVVKPTHQDFIPIVTLDDDLKDTGIDSMDGMMMCIYFCDIYGIPDEIGKEMTFKSARECWDFIQLHKTKEPSGSVEDAIKGVDW
jgi:hypothetical protein